MSKVRVVRITGPRAALRGLLADAGEQLGETGEVQVELTVEPNDPDDPSLQLELSNVGCEDEDELLVEYEEIDLDTEEAAL